MMMCVSSTGYILETFGPYFSNGLNNDAAILNQTLKKEKNLLDDFFSDNDVFVVDRGFRDSVVFLNELGFAVKMQAFLINSKQHSTEEANATRLVTKVRWIIEAINGIIKKWKYFANIVPNSNIPYIKNDFRFICALINKFKLNYRKNDAADTLIAKAMLKRVSQKNHLIDIIKNLPDDCKRTHKARLVTDFDSIKFPKLTEKQLRDITFGVYQVNNGESYTLEVVNKQGSFDLEVLLEKPTLLRVNINSRHHSQTKYKTYIQFTQKSIDGWYCTCEIGI